MFHLMRKLSTIVSPILASIFLFSSTIGVAQASTQKLNAPYLMGYKHTDQKRTQAASLFDHNTDSYYTPKKAQLLERNFNKSVELKAFKVYGNADYKVNVECYINGVWESRDNWKNVDLHALNARWHTYALKQAVKTDKVRISLIPLHKVPKGIAEIAFVSDRETVGATNRIFNDSGVEAGSNLLYTLINTTRNTKRSVDKSFSFTTAYSPSQITKAQLSYEVEGVSGGASVIRAVNDELAQGGLLLQAMSSVKAGKKILVTEEINPQWLNAGINNIKFMAHETGEIPQPYYVSNVKLSVTTSSNAQSKRSRLVAFSPQKSLSYKEYAYLRGFVETQNNPVAKITVDGKEVAESFGAFETLVKVKGSKNVNVTATLQDGTVLTEKVALNTTLSLFQAKSVQLSSSGVAYLSGKQRAVQTKKVLATAENSTQIALEDATLTIEKESLQSTKEIKISTLNQRDLPALDQGMVNVTKEELGYRFLPHGIKFDKENQLELGYDESKLPKGMSAKDVKTYFFDEEMGRWMPLPKIAAVSGVVTSKTDHFTDMINAVIKSPDAPQAKAYGATQIKDLKVANPGAKINLIEAPKASAMGDAQLNYPIEIPAGRHGMAPQLGVNYSSGASNSWMGLGWNLSTPSIGIDTRWGVPRYDPDDETETYTISGQQLTPLAHRVVIERTAEKRFYPRVEGAFNKIIRHGDSPKNYWWEVTAKNGTKSFYGGLPSNGIAQNAILTDSSGNIAHWALLQSIDTYGNTITYSYNKVEDTGVRNNQGTVPGFQLYIKNINYTGFNEDSGAYDVTFIRDRELQEARRSDVTIDARLGFKKVTADLLRKVEVKFQNTAFRSYEFVYTKGAFEKTLLEKIKQYDANGEHFNTHTLSYFDDIRSGGQYVAFTPTRSWSVDPIIAPEEEVIDDVPPTPGIPTPGTGTEPPVITPPPSTDGSSDLIENVEQNIKGLINALTHVNEHSRVNLDIEGILSKDNDLFQQNPDNNGFERIEVTLTDSSNEELAQTARDGVLDLVYAANDETALDYIRAWKAPFDGTIAIDAPVALVETETDEEADGVRVSMQLQSQELWSSTIAADDYSVKVPSGVNGISVQKGEQILFRVQALSNGINDIVSWSPVVTYTDKPQDVLDANNLPLHSYGFTNEFIPQAEPIELPYAGVVRVTGDILKPIISDDVTFTLIKYSASYEQTIIWEQSYSAAQEVELQPELGDIEVKAGDKLFAIVSTQSNVDFKALSWVPIVKYHTLKKSFIDRIILGDIEVDSFNEEIKPHYTIHEALNNTLKWVASDDLNLTVNAAIPETWSGVNAVNFTLKSDGQLLAKQSITIQDILASTYEPLKLNVAKDQSIYVEYHHLGDLIDTDPSTWRPIITADAQQVNVETSGLYELPTSEGDIFYRGWGEYTYDASEGESISPIALENLQSGSSGLIIDVEGTPDTDTKSSPTDTAQKVDMAQISGALITNGANSSLENAVQPAVASIQSSSPLGDMGHVSALGGSTSQSVTLHVSVTIGFVGDTSSKNLSLGGKIGFSESENDGTLSFLDIDGDSLPDQVFVEGGQLKYKKNLSRAGLERFSTTKNIVGINTFHHSETTSMNGGFEAHFFAFAGINVSESTSTTDTYFSDVNGDGLIDIVEKGVVYYNRLIDGAPVFTTSSAETPNPTSNGGTVSAEGWIEPQTPEELAQLAAENPLHDSVRVWKAPEAGTIAIDAPVNLIQDTSDERAEYEKADGVIVSIQHKESELWFATIEKDDYYVKQPGGVNTVDVEEGDQIYFRVHSRFDGAYDKVNWAPKITYTDKVQRLDANSLDVYSFDAAEDFLLSGYDITMPIDGTISISSTFSKPATSDDVILRLVQVDLEGAVTSVIWEENTGQNVQSKDIHLTRSVQSQEHYRFEVIADTNVDWAKISWKPTVTYTQTSDPEVNIFDADGNPQLILQATSSFYPYSAAYKNSIPLVPEDDWASEDNATIQIKPLLANGLIENGSVVFSIKRDEKLLAKQTIKYEENMLVTPIQTFSVDPAQKEGLYLEYHTLDTEFASLLADENASVEIRIDEDTTLEYKAGIYTENGEYLFGPMYRQWGQFVYNANEGRDENPIDEELLNLNDLLANLNSGTAIDSAEDNESLEAAFDEEGYNPADTIFVMMVARGDVDLWQGMDPSTQITPTTVSSSRFGLKNIVEDNVLATSSDAAGPIRGISKVTETQSQGYAISFGIGHSVTDQKVDTLTDFKDMNGDRYPDIIGDSQMQYTTMSGGLKAGAVAVLGYSGIPTFTTATSESNTAGTFPVPELVTVGEKTVLSAKDSDPVSVSGNIGLTEDVVKSTLRDINGDGLPDRLYDNGAAALNLGYKFTAPENWGFSKVQEGESNSIGGGASINLNNLSMALGLSISTAKNKHERSLMDLNSDGLIDVAYVDHEDNVIKTRLNTGNGFSQEIAWNGINKLYESETVNGAVNIVFTLGFNITPPGIRICINPGGSVGVGGSRDEATLSDINGDGYLDYLRSTDDDSLQVKTSTIGKTNLLKMVQRPLGATIELDYEKSGNTYKNPHHKWVLSEVETFDAHTGDGADTMKQVFTYEDGYYDRHERESYGFAWVSTADIDTANADKVYRKNINHYINDNYYEKGLLDYTKVTDDANKTYVEKYNTYNTVDIFTQQSLNDEQKAQNNQNTFSQLVQAQTLFYEGEMAAGQRTAQAYVYDSYGNVITQVDLGESADASDDYSATVSYYQDVDAYILSVPETIHIYDNEGKLLRHREATVDDKGSVTQVRIGTGAATLKTDMTYDVYGNLANITYPLNHKGQRYALNYVIDSVVHTYTTAMHDSFGYTARAAYDFRFGAQVSQNDINNQPIVSTLDAKGRIVSIAGPLEAGLGVATITHSYYPDAVTPYALTQHYDEGNANTIDTVTFIDGLMRVIQTKKDAAIDADKDGTALDMMSVSGHVKFDSFGRSIATYYPVSEPLGSASTFNPAVDTISPTHTSYDILDRKEVTTLPDGVTLSNAYGFKADRDGVNRFHTLSTDANGYTAESFKDVRERITAVLQHNPAAGQADIWTSYSYNAVNELLQVKDDRGNLTQAVYDVAGRRTHINNPDTGWIESIYDGAGNVIYKITDNLRDKGQAIAYVYDYTRLSNINYPNNTQNNVTYSYGDNAALYNAGRITKIRDASGERVFEYGKLGETTKETRTLFTYTGSAPKTYVTQYRYDTWNRLRELTYPDGEVLTHTYDTGGKLSRLRGKKGSHNYHYLKALTYDKFGQRVYTLYANDTTATYSYEEERRRLSNIVATDAERTFMNNTYSYDNMQNILAVGNSAAVEVDSSFFGGETSQSFDYDNLYQLTGANGKWTDRKGHQYRYDLAMTYDTIGNIKSKKQSHDRLPYEGEGWLPQKETSYDWTYRHTAKQPHAPTKIGDRNFIYDKNGNQLGWNNKRNRTLRTIVWDEENRVKNISDNGHTSTYVYDASGDRTLKRTAQGETFYVNAYYVIREGTVASKHFFAGSQRIATKMVKKEQNGNSGNIVLEKEQYYYHPDHLGSSSFVTDEKGKVYEHLEYFPFGETFAHEHSNTQITPYKFTGKELDEVTGLYYYGARYYDPRTSVWQSPDPIIEKYMDGEANGGFHNPFNLKMYSYSYNNPVNFTDPDGAVVWFIPLVIFIAKEVASEAVEQATGVPMPTLKNGSKLVVKQMMKEAKAGKWKGPVDYKSIADPRKVKEGGDFTTRQKKQMRELNKKQNNGVIRSDRDGTIADTPVQAKSGVKANMKQAEIDHITPKAKGGTNETSNAQLLTKEQNLKKSDK